MSTVEGPLRYIGGKHYLAGWHVSRFARHDCFVSVFFGGGSELFAKPPGNEIVNDRSGTVMNLWRVLRDQRDEFIERCELTPLSRQLVETIDEVPAVGDVERAWRFFVKNRQAFSGTATGGKPPSWSISRRTRRGINESASAWMSAVDRLAEVADRLRGVALECDDFEKIIERFDGPGVFFYCDPPYWLGEGDNTYYEHPFTLWDHQRLARCLSNIQGLALVCGYDSPLYRDLYPGWRRESRNTTVHAASGDLKDYRSETIWMNY